MKYSQSPLSQKTSVDRYIYSWLIQMSSCSKCVPFSCVCSQSNENSSINMFTTFWVRNNQKIRGVTSRQQSVENQLACFCRRLRVSTWYIYECCFRLDVEAWRLCSPLESLSGPSIKTIFPFRACSRQVTTQPLLIESISISMKWSPSLSWGFRS